MAKCDINNKQRLFDVLKSKDIVDMANDNNIEYSATLSGNILNISVKSGVDNAYIVQSLIENAVNNSFPGILLSSRIEDGYINTILFTERVNNTIKDKRNKRIAKLRFDRSIVRNDGEVISPSGYPAIPMANDRNGIIKNLEKQIHQEATNAWDLGEVADVSNRGVGKLINEYYKSDVVSYYDEGTDLTFPRVQVPEFLVDIYYNELSNIIKERREKWSNDLMEQSSFWDENGDVDQYNSISTTNTEDDIWNDDSGLDKQRIKAQYSQYLEQNPNGNVEQFKSWVDEFNRNKSNLEQQSENKTVDEIYKEKPHLKEFIDSITDEDNDISIYKVKNILDKHGEGRIVKLNKILYNAINRLWDNSIFAQNNIKIKFVDSLPENAVGNFNRDENEITIDKRKFLNNVINNDNDYPIFYLGYILNHEIIHYLTPKDLSLKIEYVDMALNGEFGDVFRLEHEREFGKNIKELYDVAIEKLYNVEDYGFLNLAEFVAEAMSNPSFQEKLASIPFKTSKKSLWKRFTEILSAYLSLYTKKPITDTLLEAVIAETTNYITENSNIQKTYKRRKSGKTENIDIGYDFVYTTQKNINSLSNFISQKSQERLNKIEEIFNENETLANAVYEALGFSTNLLPIDNVIESENKEQKKERLNKRREIVLKEISAIEELINTKPDEIVLYETKLYEYDYQSSRYFDKSNWENSDSKYKTILKFDKNSYLANHLEEELQKRIKNLQIINSSLFDDVEKINYSNIFKEGKSYSSLEVLKYISDNRKDILSGIAKTLIKYAEKNNVEIQIVKEAPKKIAGAYFYSNKIEIYGSKNVTSHTLIHEIIHSFSSDYIKNNPKSLPVSQLENILKNILDKKILKEYSNFEGSYEDYATKNIHELLSEIISRPDILSHLALYDTNYNLIKDIYKKETLLDKIIKTLSDIFNFSKNEIETLSDLILFNARDIFEASPLWSEFNRNQITPEQKQQALQVYSEYLEQNPNGNIEQFKNLIKGEKREYKSSPASLPLRGGKKVEYKNASEFSEAINFLSQRFEINVVLNKLNDDSNLNVFGNTGSLGNYDAINNTININKDEEIYEGVIVHEFIHGFSRLVQTYNKEAFRSLVDYHYNSLSTDTETLRSLWRIAYDYGNLETIPKTLSELPEGQNKDYIYDEIFTRLIEREYNENGSLKDFEKPSSIFYKLFELVKKFFGIKYNREKEFSKLTTSSTVKDFYNILKKVDNLKVSKEEYIRGTNTNESIYNVYKILNNREFGELNSQEKEEVNRYMKEYNDYMKSLPKLSISQKSQERLNKIEEIFNENPELANSVYEALGFKQNINKEIAKSKNNTDEYRFSIGNFVKEKNSVRVTKNNEGDFSIHEGDLSELTKEKKVALFKEQSNIIPIGEKIVQRGASSFDGIRHRINLKNHGFSIEYQTDNLQEYKSTNKKEVQEFANLYNLGKVIEKDGKLFTKGVVLTKEENIDFITPQQEQQAQILYSSYLDTIFPDSKVTEIDNYLYNNVLNQLEQENIIEKDCSGGKLKAEKGLQSNFTKGGEWKIYEIFEGKSHKQGGIDINIKNNQISFTNKNGSIKAKYGLVIPKDN